MLILTTNDVAAAKITESLGLVRGTTVRTRHWGHNLIAAFNNLAVAVQPDGNRALPCAQDNLTRCAHHDPARHRHLL